ncbi:unnamed protein product [Sympodiomycopsis kandeliae]
MGLLDEVDLWFPKAKEQSRSGEISQIHSDIEAGKSSNSQAKITHATSSTSVLVPGSKIGETSRHYATVASSRRKLKSKAEQEQVDQPADSDDDVPLKLLQASPPRRSTKGKERANSFLTEALEEAHRKKRKKTLDMSQMHLEELQDEARRWGFRSTSSRPALEDILRSVWNSMNQSMTEPQSEPSANAPSEPQTPITGSESGSDAGTGSDLNSQEATPTDLPESSLALNIQSAIQNEKQLYRRILLYEPIPFEEVWSLLLRKDSFTDINSTEKQKSKGKLQGEVRAWLDLQGIVWYEGDVSGPRSRH